MSLESYYYVSQIISAIAIIMSLIFVGLQLRQSSRNQFAQMRELRMQVLREDSLLVAEYYPLFVAASRTPKDMSDQDMFKLMQFYFRIVQTWRSNFRQWQSGQLDDVEWNDQKQIILQSLGQPAFRAAIEMRVRADPHFDAILDELVATARHTPLTKGMFWQFRSALENEIETSRNRPPV